RNWSSAWRPSRWTGWMSRTTSRRASPWRGISSATCASRAAARTPELGQQALDQPAELGPALRGRLSRIILARQNALTQSVDRRDDEARVGRRIRAAELLHRAGHRELDGVTPGRGRLAEVRPAARFQPELVFRDVGVAVLDLKDQLVEQHVGELT